jgi:pimeloyl-ACP methyl ester carboxylesterase
MVRFTLPLVAALSLLTPTVGPAWAGSPDFVMRAVPLESDPPEKLRSAPGGGRTLAPALLYTPATGANPYGPAIVMLDDGPGSHPLAASQAARFAAEKLAAAGYTVLSLYSGQERNYPTVPFADNRWAIKNALDYLESEGFEDIALVGQGYGALVAADYVKGLPDNSLDNGPERRVKTLVLINPALEPTGYPAFGSTAGIGARENEAKQRVADGTGRYPSTIEPGHNVAKAQADWYLQGFYSMPAEAWLDYWGGDARQRNRALLTKLPVPALVIAGTQAAMAPEEALAPLDQAGIPVHRINGMGNDASARADIVTGEIAKWLSAQGLATRPAVRLQTVDAKLPDGRLLYGLEYSPAAGVSADRPVVVLVSGRTGDTLESSTHWMGWRIAQKGYRVIAPHFRISGIGGIQTETMAHMREDLGVWIDSLGISKRAGLVLAGHSNGGIWITDYQLASADPRVRGMIYFAPTVDAQAYKRRQIGDAEYERIERLAAGAISKGERDRMLGLESVVAFSELYGSKARTDHSVRVKGLKLPGLAIIGGKDPLMQDWFVNAFTANYGGKLETVRYPDGSHGFRENKDRLADDVASWLAENVR